MMYAKVVWVVVVWLSVGAVALMAAPITYVEQWDSYADGYDGLNYNANWVTDPGPHRYPVGEYGSYVWSPLKSLEVKKTRATGITHDLTTDAMSAGQWVEPGTGDDALVAWIFLDLYTLPGSRSQADAFLEVSRGGAHAPNLGVDPNVVAFGMTYGINGTSEHPWVYDGSSWQEATGVTTDKRWNRFRLTITPEDLTIEGFSRAEGSHTFVNNSDSQFDHLSIRTVDNEGQRRYLDDVMLLGGVIMPPATLVWDRTDSDWAGIIDGTSHWTGGINPDDLPSAGVGAMVDGGRATVYDAREAKSLSIEDVGVVRVAAGGALTVVEDVTVEGSAQLAVDGSLTATRLLSSGTLRGSGTIDADFLTEGVVTPGESTGMLTFQAAFELGDNATYRCEIGEWDSETVDDPWSEDPPIVVNDKMRVTTNDAYLSGGLELAALSKLSPPQPLPENPEVLVQWYGDQVRAIVSTEAERSIRYTFNHVPQAQPEDGVWYIQDEVDPDTGEIIHARNWDQGHLGYGVFLTSLGDGGANTAFPPDPPHYGLSYTPNATQVHVFQAADGDTNGDRNLNSLDIQNILSLNKYLTGEPANWIEGNFNGHDPEGPGRNVCNSKDIQLILATALWGTPQPYCEPPDLKSAELEGAAELILTPGEDNLSNLKIETHGLPLTSYVIHSAQGVFTGEEAANLGMFQQDDDFMIGGAGFGVLVDGVHDLGDVIGAGRDGLENLSFTYTVQGVPGLFEGHLVAVPEPGAVVMLLTGGLGLWLAIRRSSTRRIATPASRSRNPDSR